MLTLEELQLVLTEDDASQIGVRILPAVDRVDFPGLISLPSNAVDVLFRSGTATLDINIDGMHPNA